MEIPLSKTLPPYPTFVEGIRRAPDRGYTCLLYTSTISMALMVVGTALILLGVFRLFWKSKEMVYLPTGSVTKERSMFFDLKHIGELTEMIERGNPDCEAGIKSESSGNVRLSLIHILLLRVLNQQKRT